MKKNVTAAAIIIAFGATLISCGPRRSPGIAYMPDMAYSVAYDAYAVLDSNKFTSDKHNKGSKIYYNSLPVTGTVKRGDLFIYTLPHDSAGYAQSASVKNPIDSVSKYEMAEAGRLYNINCAICHGAKGKGDGPIAEKVPGVANLTAMYIKPWQMAPCIIQLNMVRTIWAATHRNLHPGKDGRLLNIYALYKVQ